MANPRSDAGQPALVAVASEGDADMLLTLMAHGARVSEAGQDGVTVAHALAAAGAAGAMERVMEWVKGGAGGSCTPGDDSAATGTETTGTEAAGRTCAQELRAMVKGRERQNGWSRCVALHHTLKVVTRHTSHATQV